MPRVLVVDDHPDTAHSFAMLLDRLGHVALAVTSGADALQRAGDFLPDMALIDVQMPGMDGHEVARGLRGTPGLEHILLVAVTGYAHGDRRLAPPGDFDLFLLKPVSPDDLVSVVRVCEG
jgi:CheY-like chemotaxis protein